MSDTIKSVTFHESCDEGMHLDFALACIKGSLKCALSACLVYIAPSLNGYLSSESGKPGESNWVHSSRASPRLIAAATALADGYTL